MHRESRNDSASALRFSECMAILSRVDSELSFDTEDGAASFRCQFLAHS